MWSQFNCPLCKIEIEIYVERWNGKTICPNCNSKLFIDFDIIVMDDYEEWDIYDIKPYDNVNNDNKFHIDYFESRLPS